MLVKKSEIIEIDMVDTPHKHRKSRREKPRSSESVPSDDTHRPEWHKDDYYSAEAIHQRMIEAKQALQETNNARS